MSKKKRYSICITIIIIILGIVGIRENIHNLSKEITVFPSKENDKNQNIKMIKVYISGEILKTGLYNLKYKSSLSDLIEMAGGLTEKADTKKMNLEKILKDGDQISIPAFKENKKAVKKITTSDSAIKIININTASKQELMELDGIGSSIADSIIKYREKNGDFQNIDDIKNVKRIGISIFSKIKNNITVK